MDYVTKGSMQHSAWFFALPLSCLTKKWWMVSEESSNDIGLKERDKIYFPLKAKYWKKLLCKVMTPMSHGCYDVSSTWQLVKCSFVNPTGSSTHLFHQPLNKFDSGKWRFLLKHFKCSKRVLAMSLLEWQGSDDCHLKCISTNIRSPISLYMPC